MIRSSLRSGALAVLFGLLSACSILPEAEPLRAYLLPTSVSPLARKAPEQGPTLRILTPQSSRLLATPRIAVIPEAARSAATAAHAGATRRRFCCAIG